MPDPIPQTTGLRAWLRRLLGRKEPTPAPDLPALPGTGAVAAADPFPKLVASLEKVPPKRDNGSSGGQGYQTAPPPAVPGN